MCIPELPPENSAASGLPSRREGSYNASTVAARDKQLDVIASELKEGISLDKCLQCGCMKGTLEEMRSSLHAAGSPPAPELIDNIESWLARIEATLYS